jgi:phosphoglycolate phosphatase
MLGDSTFDMALAGAAAVTAIGVMWGYHRPDALTATGAETIVEDYARLGALLRETVLNRTLV